MLPFLVYLILEYIAEQHVLKTKNQIL